MTLTETVLFHQQDHVISRIFYLRANEINKFVSLFFNVVQQYVWYSAVTSESSVEGSMLFAQAEDLGDDERREYQTRISRHRNVSQYHLPVR